MPPGSGTTKLGKLLADKMARTHTTQQELADVVGCSTQNVGKWQRGQVPSKRYWPKLAAWLKIDPATIPSLLPPAQTTARASLRQDLGRLEDQVKRLVVRIERLEAHLD